MSRTRVTTMFNLPNFPHSLYIPSDQIIRLCCKGSKFHFRYECRLSDPECPVRAFFASELERELFKKKKYLSIFNLSRLKHKPRHDSFCVSPALNLLWKISFIDKDLRACYTSEIHTIFAQDGFDPIVGGVYQMDKDFIMDPSNRLLHGRLDELVVKCEVIDLRDKDKIFVQSSGSRALQNFRSLLENPKFSDVTFVVGGREFKLHKNILSARSPVLAAMFEHSDLEEARENRVEIIDVDVAVFEQMLNFIYGAISKLRLKQYALELFEVSDKYQLETLKRDCVKSLITSLTVESVAAILTSADMHSVEELKSICIEFIQRNSAKVIATDGWKQMAKQRPELVVELYEDIAVKKIKLS